jgi:hypothetical protein
LGSARALRVREEATMVDSPALSVARAYQRAWTGGSFDEAAGYLAENLAVEVPINSYPTKASFIQAVRFTREMTSRIELLSEVGGDGEAMVLYDMLLPFGTMRVAEHFSVSDGRIERIRQIHDTHALRSAACGASPDR